jgi:hypothetical protein
MIQDQEQLIPDVTSLSPDQVQVEIPTIRVTDSAPDVTKLATLTCLDNIVKNDSNSDSNSDSCSGSGSEYETDTAVSNSEYETDTDNEEREVKGTEYNSADIHDEVECMLEGDNADILELIATDPKYYLDLVQNYTHMRDGREIYLPDLFNILIRRTDDKLTIKFKMSDNTQWYEIGFHGGEFNDDTVYDAFAEKVIDLVRHPALTKRQMIEESLKPGVKEAPPVVSQGNQYKLNKIDRFLGRTHTEPAAPSPSEGCVNKPEEDQSPQLSPLDQAKAKQSALKAEIRDVPAVQSSPPESHQGSDQVDHVLRSYYKIELAKKLTEEPNEQSLSMRLKNLKGNCPSFQALQFNQLVGLLTDQSPFVSGLVSCLDTASPSQQILLINYLKSVSSARSYDHQQLAGLLKLKPNDMSLLETYNIDLTDLV